MCMKFKGLDSLGRLSAILYKSDITKTSLFKYTENFTTKKNENFEKKF